MKALGPSHPSLSSSTSSSASSSGSGSSSSSWIHLRSVLFVVNSSSPAHFSHFDRGRLKSPWSHRKRKHVLSPQHWSELFTADGKLRDGGVKFLKKVRSGGVDPTIRPQVWPFLLGVYELNSTEEERELLRIEKRKQYDKLRRQCRRLFWQISEGSKFSENGEIIENADGGSCTDSSSHEDVVSASESLLSKEKSSDVVHSDDICAEDSEGDGPRRQTRSADASGQDTESSSEDSEIIQASASDNREENDANVSSKEDCSLAAAKTPVSRHGAVAVDDFVTWQRIIRVDAVRANPEWIPYSATQALVSEVKAQRSAEAVGLKEHEHLEPCRVFHAARLVAILEAYAVHDPEIGYCQGMSDLLSPIIAVMQEDDEAFWCFVGFMKKARHNFRLDELGIRRQLSIVSKIIKFKDSHLYKHLEKMEAEDCFFVYRMVVVLFRRELSFEQTLCMWEVMWADQAAIRTGIGKHAGSRIRQRVPPTDDLLLYAIAASVLQRRKLIIEKYSSMDEILRECNGMSGQLDVWKLLDDAHNLVVNLHDKIESSF
ncbi:Rab GTPase-activating protein 22 [Linum perenne]